MNGVEKPAVRPHRGREPFAVNPLDKLVERLPAPLRGVVASHAGTAPIGLEVDGERLHAVQLERGEPPRIRAACSLDMTPLGPGGQVAPLRRLLGERGFRGRRVVSVLPDEHVKLMVVNYESGPQQDDAHAIVALVQERVDDALQDCVVDYLPLRTAEKHGARSALVAVARREVVIAHLEVLRHAGLEVDALEIAPVAVRRLAVLLAGSETSRNSLVIHCGAQRSHLTMLAGRRLILYREIDYGEDLAVETLGKSLDMTPEAAADVLFRYGVLAHERGDQAWDDPAAAVEISETITEILKPGLYGLVEQVEMAAVYTASEWHGASIDELLLLGRIARWPGIDRMLTEMTSIPARALDPGALCTGETATGVDASLAVAVGLALRGMVTGDE